MKHLWTPWRLPRQNSYLCPSSLHASHAIIQTHWISSARIQFPAFEIMSWELENDRVGANKSDWTFLGYVYAMELASSSFNCGLITNIFSSRGTIWEKASLRQLFFRSKACTSHLRVLPICGPTFRSSPPGQVLRPSYCLSVTTLERIYGDGFSIPVTWAEGYLFRFIGDGRRRLWRRRQHQRTTVQGQLKVGDESIDIRYRWRWRSNSVLGSEVSESSTRLIDWEVQETVVIIRRQNGCLGIKPFFRLFISDKMFIYLIHLFFRVTTFFGLVNANNDQFLSRHNHAHLFILIGLTIHEEQRIIRGYKPQQALKWPPRKFEFEIRAPCDAAWYLNMSRRYFQPRQSNQYPRNRFTTSTVNNSLRVLCFIGNINMSKDSKEPQDPVLDAFVVIQDELQRLRVENAKLTEEVQSLRERVRSFVTLHILHIHKWVYYLTWYHPGICRQTNLPKIVFQQTIPPASPRNLTLNLWTNDTSSFYTWPRCLYGNRLYVVLSF